MKKLLCVLLCVALAFSLVACGNGAADKGNGAASSANSDASDASVTDKKTSGKKTLVVYYSATGSTKSVAEKIADNLNADIFEIVPETPYTSADLDWRDDNSRVSLEHSDESKRDVPLAKTAPDNWEQYDTVYIGYPIWWGIAAWPVNGFVSANDFSNKTVIPFCTSSSSGIGNSGELLKQIAGSGNWLEGRRFASAASKEDVENWLNEALTN